MTTYAITLPEELVVNIPRHGSIEAGSPEHAVSMYVHRHLDKLSEDGARGLVDSLKRRGGKHGLASYASEVPEMDDVPVAREPRQESQARDRQGQLFGLARGYAEGR